MAIAFSVSVYKLIINVFSLIGIPLPIIETCSKKKKRINNPSSNKGVAYVFLETPI